MSQVSGERSERVPRARPLPGYVLVCSGRFGVRSIRAPIDAMCCDALYGTLYFPFYGQGKARVTMEEKEEDEKEKKSSRIAGSFSFTRVPSTL